MYAHALAHLVGNLHRLTPRHAALVRLWHGIAEARGLTAGQARAVVTVWERFTGEQGEYAMIDVNDRLPKLGELVLTAKAGNLRPWYYSVGRRVEREDWTYKTIHVWIDTYDNEYEPDYWQPITPPAGKDGNE
jgi:hypothetical protein